MAWPSTYDDWGITGNPVRSDLVARLNAIYTALETIQHTLGINPQGASATVVERLEAIELAMDDKANGQDVADTFQALQDSTDPFPSSLYPLFHIEPGNSREHYVTNTAPSTGDDGALHFDLNG